MPSLTTWMLRARPPSSHSATKAAVHAFTEGLRVQLADTSVRVMELAPPRVRTTLFGQESDEQAMPVEASD
ncbi:SDR family NAD(P)-dependent oxidoreductase [Hydrogenophaga sp. A37]|uniref:SDR family NAD(P)-dependent oxidoreductase n=1 Tax=Hydrogenophaga sp. A37 TaxID=1945864 RepID=UPI00209BA41B|nr:SDR family NAD(P)-dependent oxidoreductase [Hydrogenophaga sp. A37]